MTYPISRPRRLRASPQLRSLVRETRVPVECLMAPLFVVPGKAVRNEIGSMPGQFHLSVDAGVTEARKLRELGVTSVLLFALPETKDEIGSAAWNPTGIIPTAVRTLKKEIPDLTVVTDLCFCEYTSHGHCGVMKNGALQNDETLDNLVRQALVHANAGVDMIAPSGMIDGMVHGLRKGLDGEGHQMLPIMSYSAKYASAFYGPFREAVQSAPEYGDRKSYQMDPANREEALREVALDIEEGADIVMVKPALSYLDIIRSVKERHGVPVAAYNVSGEYAMVKAAAQKGWIDEERAMIEILTSIRRAGSDIIITYFAEQYAKYVQADKTP